MFFELFYLLRYVHEEDVTLTLAQNGRRMLLFESTILVEIKSEESPEIKSITNTITNGEFAEQLTKEIRKKSQTNPNFSDVEVVSTSEPTIM